MNSEYTPLKCPVKVWLTQGIPVKWYSGNAIEYKIMKNGTVFNKVKLDVGGIIEIDNMKLRYSPPIKESNMRNLPIKKTI